MRRNAAATNAKNVTGIDNSGSSPKPTQIPTLSLVFYLGLGSKKMLN